MSKIRFLKAIHNFTIALMISPYVVIGMSKIRFLKAIHNSGGGLQHAKDSCYRYVKDTILESNSQLLTMRYDSTRRCYRYVKDTILESKIQWQSEKSVLKRTRWRKMCIFEPWNICQNKDTMRLRAS